MRASAFWILMWRAQISLDYFSLRRHRLYYDRRLSALAQSSPDSFTEGASNMEKSEPQEPSAMSRSTAIAYAIGLPLSLLGLIFLPAGSIGWQPGWAFLAVLLLCF